MMGIVGRYVLIEPGALLQAHADFFMRADHCFQQVSKAETLLLPLKG
jgi:hypothetical protein